ncbi:hypothetical protein R1CP_38775 (plasmid) [Rhodococcus opacus]|uniref:Transposase n=1 Tax=Rhodococcus opacus TaxID=37919 RepID=A0A1B1KI08_RHOOP|nr:hypothetical protein [Rhodococcus opacus]ANS32253.1 hypothetical protein R1CP_38270 [Rhodococcus opacus]ANS32346.1 hypothetical protein R1CP_38775 [Rhodococcus opacus]
MKVRVLSTGGGRETDPDDARAVALTALYHRLNTGGNRQLNSVLHTIAVCQARDPGPGRVYHQRKLDEGKTRAEAWRALKRCLANVLYRRMRRDQQHAPPTAA